MGVLEDEGYCAAAVESGEACLEELARQSYGLVLLDVWLPGIGGIETLERIQEIPLAERPVAVIISGASCSALAWAPLRKHQERTGVFRPCPVPAIGAAVSKMLDAIPFEWASRPESPCPSNYGPPCDMRIGAEAKRAKLAGRTIPPHFCPSFRSTLQR